MSHEHFGPSTDTRNRNQPDRLQDEAMSARDCRSQRSCGEPVRIATSGAPRQGNHRDYEPESASRAGDCGNSRGGGGGFGFQIGGIQIGQQQRYNSYDRQYSNQGFRNPYHPNHNRHESYRPNPSFNDCNGANYNNFNRGYGQRGDVGSQILSQLAFVGINRAFNRIGGGNIGIGIGGFGGGGGGWGNGGCDSRFNGYNNGYDRFNNGYNNGYDRWNGGNNNGYDRYDRDRYDRERYDRERYDRDRGCNNNQFDQNQHYQRVIAEQRRINEQQQRYMQEQQRLYLERERRQQLDLNRLNNNGGCIPTDRNQPYYPPQPNVPPCDGRQGTYDGRQGTYDGRQGTYDGRQGTYDGRQGTYDGRQGTYDGRGVPNDGRQQYYYDPHQKRNVLIDPRSRYLPPSAVRNGDQYREDNVVPNDGYVPNDGRGYVPNDGRDYVPNDGRGQVPNDGQGYVPNYPPEYTPVPGTFEPRDPVGPVEMYDGQPLFENRSGWTLPHTDEQRGGQDHVEHAPEQPNPHAPNAPILNALARRVFGIGNRDDRSREHRPNPLPPQYQFRR